MPLLYQLNTIPQEVSELAQSIGFTITTFKKEDERILFKFYENLSDLGETEVDEPEEYFKQFFDNQQTHGGFTIKNLKHHTIGFIGFEYEQGQNEAQDRLYISALYVFQPYRKYSLGMLLIAAVMEAAFENHIPMVTCTSQKAGKYWEKLGFEYGHAFYGTEELCFKSDPNYDGFLVGENYKTFFRLTTIKSLLKSPNFNQQEKNYLAGMVEFIQPMKSPEHFLLFKKKLCEDPPPSSSEIKTLKK